MSVSIKVLMVEDSEDDAEFLLRELKWILPFIVTLVVAVKKL